MSRRASAAPAGTRPTGGPADREWQTVVMVNRRPSTLSEVAVRAGVSVATASKALNGRSRVAAETRARVLRAASELHFAPNPLARSLLTGRTSTVGLLIRDSRIERFVLPVLLGAEGALADIDLSLIVSDARGDEARAESLLRVMSHRKVDGVLVVGGNTTMRASITHLVDVPVVYVHCESADPDDVSHMPDDAGGAALAAEHVVAAGRHRIAHVTGPQSSRAVVQRANGVRRALRAHSLRLIRPVQYGFWSQRWGRATGERLLAAQPDIDAILCGSDQIAAGLVEAVLESGRRIPDDVAVTGFDNWFDFAEETEPPLTTIDMNLEALGAAASLELFRAIGGTRPAGGVRRHPCTLIERGSTRG